MLTNSRLPKGIRRAFPFTVLLRLPAMPSHPSLRFRPNSVSRFPLRVSISVYHTPEFSASRSPWGLPSSYAYLFLHATACGLRRTSSSKPLRMILYCLRRTLTPSASATSSSRSCTSTSGCAVTPTACRILCLRFTCFVRQHLCLLRHRRKTRYGWVTNPYPTGTFTPQDTLSFLGAITLRFTRGGISTHGTF